MVMTDGQVAETEDPEDRPGDGVGCIAWESARPARTAFDLLARETGGVSRFVTPRERWIWRPSPCLQAWTAPAEEVRVRFENAEARGG
jgi:hypothetical protein